MKELSKTQEKEINKNVITLIMKKVTLQQIYFADYSLNRVECQKRKISPGPIASAFAIKRIEIKPYEEGSDSTTRSKRTASAQPNLLLFVCSNSLHLRRNICT